MPLWYVGFCPLGDDCSKKGKRVCCCSSVDEVKAKISWHLQSSTYHVLTEEQALIMADTAQIDEIEYEVEVEEDGAKGKQNKGGGGGKVSKPKQTAWSWNTEPWSSSSSSRSAPYTVVQVAANNAPDEAAMGRAEALNSAIAAMGRAEAASRAAARMARSAAVAFEEENAIITAAMAKVQTFLGR